MSYVGRFPSKGKSVSRRRDETCFTVTLHTEKMDGPRIFPSATFPRVGGEKRRGKKGELSLML